MERMSTAVEIEQAPVAPPEAKSGRTSIDRLLAWGVNVALVAVLAVFAAAMIFPALTGRMPMTVLTGSMQPTLPPGHIVVFGPVDTATLKPGDVIAYQPDNNVTGGIPITHRVIAVDSPGDPQGHIIVQGDAVPLPDAPVRPDQVIGKMDYFIPYAGLLKVVAYNSGFGPVLPIASAGLLGYWLWLVIGGLLPKRKNVLGAGPVNA
jgi:signal peptidase